MLFKSCLLISFFVVAAYCYGYDSVDESDEFGEPGDGLGDVLDESNAVQDVTDKGEEFMRKKCLAHGGSYEDVKNAKEEMLTCVKPLFNSGKMLAEYGWSESHGALNKFFKKYCDKAPRIRRCLVPYFKTLKRCLSEDGRKSARVALQMFRNFIEFSCSKDGHKIAKFISRGGPQCLKSRVREIKKCYRTNKLPMPFVPASAGDIDRISEFSFVKNCGKIGSLRKCVVSNMRTCPKPKTAKTMDALFKFVLKDSPCKKFSK